MTSSWIYKYPPLASEQPRALYLADVLEDAGKPADITEAAAAELRRLHAELERMTDAHLKQGLTIAELFEQRDALLEALKLARSIIGHPDDAHTQMIDAAIKAVEGEKT